MDILPEKLHVEIDISKKDQRYRFTKELKVVYKNINVTIPVGFYTDFGSIPKVLHSILSPMDRKCIVAYAVHDYLFYTGDIPRVEADKNMLKLMKKYGVSWWKRKSVYRGVRAGGMFAWNEHRKRK